MVKKNRLFSCGSLIIETKRENCKKDKFARQTASQGIHYKANLGKPVRNGNGNRAEITKYVLLKNRGYIGSNSSSDRSLSDKTIYVKIKGLAMEDAAR